MKIATSFVIVTALTLSAAHLQAQSASGRLLVANQQSASASIVDLTTGESTEIQVGAGPHEAAISNDGKWGVISVYGERGTPGNKLAVIDMTQKKVVRHIDLGTYTRPHGLVTLAGKSFRVTSTSETTQNLLIVDVDKGTVESVTPTGAAGSHMAAITTDGKRAFTANVGAGTMTALDLANNKATGSVAIATQSEGIAATPSGNEAWVGSNNTGTVSVVNTAAMKIDTVLTGFMVPYRLSISHDGMLAFICEAEGGQISIVDVKTRKTLGAVKVGGSPRGVTVSADNRTAFVTLGPENEVVVVDIATQKVTSRHKVGTAPDGVAHTMSK